MVSGLQVELGKAPSPAPCARPWGDADGEQPGEQTLPGAGSWGAARWSRVCPGDVPCAGTAGGRDAISSVKHRDLVRSLVWDRGRGARPALRCWGFVPPADVAGLCAGHRALRSAPSLPAPLNTCKTDGSCDFTALCPGSCAVPPCWRSFGPLPAVLPTGARSHCCLTSPGGSQSLAPTVNPTMRSPLWVGRGCLCFPRPGSVVAWGRNSGKQESRMGTGRSAAPARSSREE